MAIAYAQTGDHEAALRAGAVALGLYEAAGAGLEAGSLRNSLALTYLQVGNVARAADMASEARVSVSRLGDRRLLAHVAETQAQIALAQDDEASVIGFANEALDLARSTENANAEAAALLTLARLHRQRGRTAESESTYRDAAELLRRVGPRQRLTEVLHDWADLLVSEHRHEDAVPLLQEALRR